ncbi:MAG: protein-glutamate O-methyltransferase CheR [Caulobacterales bacterium]
MSKSPEIAFLTEIVLTQAGQTLGADAASAVQRLAALARREGMGDSMELLRLARTGKDAALAAAIIDAVVPHDTRFFRDRSLWKALRAEALPKLLLAHQGAQPLRIWSAGCSYGQECYSFSMAAVEIAPQTPVEIVGTDISERAIERARSGVYTQFEVQRGLPIMLLLKHFEREEQSWRIESSVRRRTRFARHNLLADMTPLGAFDVISCQDVLGNFDPEKRTNVLSRMIGLLKADGLFIAGESEAAWLRGFGAAVQPTQQAGVFVRKDVKRSVA